MKQTIVRVVLVAALAAPAAAQTTPEAFSAAGAARFDAAVMGLNGGSFRFKPAVGALPDLAPAQKAAWETDLRDRSTVLDATGFRATAASLAADVELSPLLNAQLKTRLRYSIGGRTVWFGGTFDGNKTAYLSILADGYQPLYFDVKGLLNGDRDFTIASGRYTLSLSPNIFHKMHSHLKVKDASSGRELVSFTVQDMLDAITAAGRAVTISGQGYHVYYTDGLKNGRADASSRMFVFVCGAAQDFHIYLIPEASVPSDKLAVFSMYNGLRVGLTNQAGHLKIYGNP
jgi:hypothetical protein